MASIRDVARESGVSIATVSRILKKDPSFKATDETRKKVYEVVTRLKYSPADHSKASSQIKLGCILALTAEKYSDPFFVSILSACEEECERQGAVITAVRNYNELKKPGAIQDLCQMGLSGIIIMERLPDNMMDLVKKSIKNIVTIDQPDYEFDGVGFDHAHANFQIMEHLLSLGYRRIAHIGGGSPGQNMMDTTRMMVYREALRRGGIPYDESIVYDCDWDMDRCETAVRRMMELPEPPDVIFAGSDSVASAVLGALYKMNLRCPEDVGVIGFNNISLSAHMIPPLSTVNIPEREIGIAAVQTLLERIKGNAGTYQRKVLFPTELVERNSLKSKEPANVQIDK